ncbi:hypothetical protein [Moraxella nasicaprae]|uniref:Uncharacterized protein n=1 Tax=Moraxella nasicaprae TaxID=2904122 RepID=A0ABY6F4R5_9GAMM|nr:hypothetical protein [Moraxella nasicaprae]UXZ05070.1 hypothetical protein LU297_01035 [Moraxella nasicaprae]
MSIFYQILLKKIICHQQLHGIDAADGLSATSDSMMFVSRDVINRLW